MPTGGSNPVPPESAAVTYVPVKRRRWWLVPMLWLTSYALLIALSTVLHVLAWIDAPAAFSSPTADLQPLKLLSNFLQIPTVHGWLAMNWINQGLEGRSIPFAIASNAIGWGTWFAIAWMMLALRRVFLRRARSIRTTEAASASAQASPAPEAVNLTRRRLLVDGAGLAIVGATSATYAASTLALPWSLTTRTYEVPITDLPTEFEGFSIAFVTDTHFGPRVPAQHIQNAVQLAVSLNPDLFVLGGDYIHNGTNYTAGALALLAPLINTRRCVAVMGNHESFFGAYEENRAAILATGVQLLENKHCYINAARQILPARPDAPCIAIAGVKDLTTDDPRPALALQGIPLGIPRILISHNPDVAEFPDLVGTPTVPGHRVDLMLCGHTHGGQVRLPLIGCPVVPSLYAQKYVSGLNQGPACPVITSNGIGLSIVPLRLNVPPEVVKIILKRRTAAS